MKNKLFLYSLLLIAISACNSRDRKAPESENDLDAARNFVRAALDGRYDLAKKYMLQDSVNLQYLENVAQRSYARASDSVARAYKAADINVHNVSRADSLTTIVIYSNTYKNDRDTLKVVKQKGEWLVDFKYLYQHSIDSAQIKAHKDSIDVVQ